MAGFLSAAAAIGNSVYSNVMASNASSKAFNRQKELMSLQALLNYEYGQKALLNSPSSSRKGLENAGYNPMLAVQNATSGANSGWTSGTGVQMDEIAGITSANATAQQAFNSMENLDKQTDSNVSLQDAQSRKLDAETSSTEIHNKYLDKNEQAQLGKLGAETTKLNRETAYMDQLAENMEKTRQLQEMGINLDYKSKIYSADRSYAGTVYNANTNESMNKRDNRVKTTLEHIKHPYSSFAHKGYTSGKGYQSSGSYKDPWK